MNDESPVIIDATSGDIETLPPSKTARYRCKLDTAIDVQRELAKLYRECRSGIIDPADATKMGWLLGEIRKAIETSSIEARLASLEEENG